MKNTTLLVVLGIVVVVLALVYTQYTTREGFADVLNGTLTNSEYNIYNKYVTVFKPAAVAAIIATLPRSMNTATLALRTTTQQKTQAAKTTFDGKSKATVMALPRDQIVFLTTLQSVLFNGVLKKCGYNMRLPLFDILTGPTSFSQATTPKPAGKLMTPEEYVRMDMYISFYIKPALEYAKSKTSDTTAKKTLDNYISYCAKGTPSKNLLSVEPFKTNVIAGVYPSDLMTNIYQEDVISFTETIRLQILMPLFKKYQLNVPLEQMSFDTKVDTLVWSAPKDISKAVSSSSKKKAASKPTAVDNLKKSLMGGDYSTIKSNVTAQAKQAAAATKKATKKTKKTSKRKNKSYKHLPTCASLDTRYQPKEEECTCLYDY